LLETRDDAAVTCLSDDLCLVQTVDFFTPIVDSAYWFGQIAAANALSDVYAMGARPLTAMNLVAWPADLRMAPLAEVLRGGAEKIAEAGADLAGGHSIDDKEPKYGLAVTGLARPTEIVYNGGSLPGDRLVLTKRLGIGVLATALKRGLLAEDDMMPAIVAAATLNDAAAEAMLAVGVHACTDVSGFGLAGHLGEMVDAAGCGAVLWRDEIPLHEGVLQLLAEGVYAGGLRANRDWIVLRKGRGAHRRGVALDADDPRMLALFDPQTSGGLLIAVAADRHPALLDALAARRVAAWTIGEIVPGPPGSIVVVPEPGDAGTEPG
jgi:selenide, water dikinase